MITPSNYNQQTKDVNFNKLPEALKKGHQFYEKSKDFYGESEAITKTIDLYMQKINEYLVDSNSKEDQQKKKPSTQMDKQVLDTWNNEGRVVFKNMNDPLLDRLYKYLEETGQDYGDTSQTGNDILVYDPERWDGGTLKVGVTRSNKMPVNDARKSTGRAGTILLSKTQNGISYEIKVTKDKQFAYLVNDNVQVIFSHYEDAEKYLEKDMTNEAQRSKSVKTSKTKKSTPKPKAKKSAPKKKPSKAANKKVATRKSKPKAAAKKVVVRKQQPKAAVKRTVKSKELSLINAYKNWHGKRKNERAFELMDAKLTKGFADGSLQDYQSVLKDMHKSVKKGLSAFKSQNISTIEVNLSNIEKLKSIVKDAKLKLQVNYLGSVGKDEGGSTNQGVVPSHLSKYGFQTASSTPEKPIDTFQLPKQIGLFLGELQPYRLAIAIHGETHSSKTQLEAQIADAFSQTGKTVGLFDLEQGGMISKDTQMAIERNTTPANRQRIMVTGEAENKLQTIKELADAFDVVIIDSWQKLDEYTSNKFDELRLNYPKTVWIVIFQRTSDGKMKGGSSSAFDAPIVIETLRPDPTDPTKNYARLQKNRGNPTDKIYQIAQKRTLDITEFQNLNKQDDAEK